MADNEEFFTKLGRQKIAALLDEPLAFSAHGFTHDCNSIPDEKVWNMLLDQNKRRNTAEMEEALALNDASESIFWRILSNIKDRRPVLKGIGATIELHRAALAVKRKQVGRELKQVTI